MTLGDLASLGSFVSGVAVLVSLIFLYYQLRQVTVQVTLAEKNQRMLMQQGRSTRASDALLRGAEPYAADLLYRASQSDRPLTGAETQSFLNLTMAVLMNWEDSFLQHAAGTLDRISLTTDELSLRNLASLPAFRAAWQMLRVQFGAGYQTYVDNIMREVSVVAPGDMAEVFEKLKRQQSTAV